VRLHANPTADLAAARHPQPLAVNISTAAELIGVHPETVARLCRRGELTHLRIGRAVRIRVADLDAWLLQRSRAGEAR
jgi:excisionase family DNA binding protein